MTMPTSSLFHLRPDSWLGGLLDSGRQEVVPPKAALSFECRQNKGECIREDLVETLQREQVAIESCPSCGHALRGDRVETARAYMACEDHKPSVDIVMALPETLLLVECKYKALPETRIVKTIEAFDANVMRKFRASREFFSQQGATAFAPDAVVLFNADSIDKVASMFNRLKLENDAEELRFYKVMDTAQFDQTFLQAFATEDEEPQSV